MRSQDKIDLVQNMQFGITRKFIPNICEAKTLKVIEVYGSSVRIELENARARGVFPLSHFQSLIRQGALVLSEENQENGETA